MILTLLDTFTFDYREAFTAYFFGVIKLKNSHFAPKHSLIKFYFISNLHIDNFDSLSLLSSRNSKAIQLIELRTFAAFSSTSRYELNSVLFLPSMNLSWFVFDVSPPDFFMQSVPSSLRKRGCISWRTFINLHLYLDSLLPQIPLILADMIITTFQNTRIRPPTHSFTTCIKLRPYLSLVKLITVTIPRRKL